MRPKQLITIAIATMLLIGGAAALGAASPVDQTNNDTDAHEENATDADEVGGATDEGGDRAENAAGVAGSDKLPEQVPDLVSEIHETIESFLNGSIDKLGDSLTEYLSGGEQANDAADDGEEQPEDTDDDVTSDD